MPSTTASQRFAALPRKESAADYNYAHFRLKHGLQDAGRMLRKDGILPGTLAPDFQLPRAGGGSLRLSALRGQPVLLHFGSYT